MKYWMINNVGRIQALVDFWDIKAGDVGEVIPHDTKLPGQETRVWICSDTRIGNNVVIGDNVYIGNDVHIGNTVYIGNSVRIGNDACIGNDVRIEKGINIGNDVNIGKGIKIGPLSDITNGKFIQFNSVGVHGRCVLMYWHDHSARVSVGCQMGISFDKFIHRINYAVGTTVESANMYMSMIPLFEMARDHITKVNSKSA